MRCFASSHLESMRWYIVVMNVSAILNSRIAELQLRDLVSIILYYRVNPTIRSSWSLNLKRIWDAQTDLKFALHFAGDQIALHSRLYHYTNEHFAEEIQHWSRCRYSTRRPIRTEVWMKFNIYSWSQIHKIASSYIALCDLKLAKTDGQINTHIQLSQGSTLRKLARAL